MDGLSKLPVYNILLRKCLSRNKLEDLPLFVTLSHLLPQPLVRVRFFAGIFLLGLVWLNLAPSVLADTAEMQTLKQGNVVVKQNPAPANAVPSVEARILIAKPPEQVWTVVSDPVTLMESERKVKKVKVLSKQANKQNVEFSVLMTPLFPAFNYVLLQELSAPYLLTFHRISGSFKDIQGSWRLIPFDNGTKTILSYTLKLDPGPLIPRGLLMTAVKSDLPNMMKNAKASITKNAD